MTERRKSIHGQWSSRWTFILAATGSAVGLGNIWKFPYVAGENGGGAFVLIYLACILLVGLPIMMSEVMLGRRGRQSPINTMRSLAADIGASRAWALLGWGGLAAGFMILSYFAAITPAGVLAAMGQAFFSLSLGMGAIMVYGSYLPANASIAQTTFTIAMADTAVAILAGMAIFPIVFAHGLEPSAGPGLVFQALPLALGNIPGGTFFATLFFVLLLFAAWTSAISLVEPAVAWMVENHGFNRVHAAAWVGIAVWALGIGSLLSFNAWSEAKLFGMTFFDVMDYLTSNVMLPLGGLFIALFAGFFLPRAASEEELALVGRGYLAWRLLARFVAPLAVAVIFLNAVGLLDWAK